MDIKLTAIIGIVVVVAAVGGAVLVINNGSDDGGNSSDDDTTTTITDVLGREVTVPKEVTAAGTHGKSMAQIMLMFDSDAWKVTDKNTISTLNKFTVEKYVMGTDTFDVVGQQPYASEDIEKLAGMDLDVIFVNVQCYDIEKDNLDILNKAVPIIYVDWCHAEGQTFIKEGAIHPTCKQSLEIVGEVLGMEDRADELVDGIDKLAGEIYVKSGTTANKSVWAAFAHGNNLSMSYVPGSLWNSATGMSFAYTGSESAASSSKELDGVILDAEEIVTYDFDAFIFFDGLANIINNADAQKVLASLYSTGHTTAFLLPKVMYYAVSFNALLIDSFFLKTYMYGGMTESEFEDKIDEIETLLFGDDGPKAFDSLSAASLSAYSDLGYNVPYFIELEIISNGDGTYGVTAAA